MDLPPSRTERQIYILSTPITMLRPPVIYRTASERGCIPAVSGGTQEQIELALRGKKKTNRYFFELMFFPQCTYEN